VRERQEAMLVEFFAAGDQPADASVASLLDVYQRLAPDPTEWKLWMEFTAYALRKPELAQRLRDDGERAREQLVARLEERVRALPAPALSAPLLARLYTAIFDGVNQQRAIDPDGVDDDLFPTLVRFVEDAMDALSTR
jgi:AcrR family transcriptional regulator